MNVYRFYHTKYTHDRVIPILIDSHPRATFSAVFTIVRYSLNSCFHSNLARAQTFESETEVGVVGSQRGAELGTAGEHAVRFRHAATHQVIDQNPNVALGPGQGHRRHGECPTACVHPSPQTLQKQSTSGSVKGCRCLINLETTLPGRQQHNLQHNLSKSWGSKRCHEMNKLFKVLVPPQPHVILNQEHKPLIWNYQFPQLEVIKNLKK